MRKLFIILLLCSCSTIKDNVLSSDNTDLSEVITIAIGGDWDDNWGREWATELTYAITGIVTLTITKKSLRGDFLKTDGSLFEPYSFIIENNWKCQIVWSDIRCEKRKWISVLNKIDAFWVQFSFPS